MRGKFPLRMIRKRKSMELKATTSLERVADISANIRQELSYLEQDYKLMVNAVQSILGFAKENKRPDPRLYWLAGDAMVNFLNRIDEVGFYLVDQNNTIARDIGVSESQVERIKAFRRRFRRISLVDPHIAWAKYRGNKVPVPKDSS